VVVELLPAAGHERKWGRLTFTRDGDWHHWLCAIAPGRKAVRLLVHKGALLADPRAVWRVTAARFELTCTPRACLLAAPGAAERGP
jgi:hypothetical protein